MQIGPYQLTRCLGRGGMGEVWLGERVAMGSAAKVVAVKLLRTPDVPARDNFVKEAKLAMLLRHSTIVQVNDVGESGGTCFMEMEWVDGLDLSQLTRRLRQSDQRMTISVAAYVIGELLKALAFAHALDVDGKRETIVHRDVTPQNVLLSRSGEVKLTDFGIAFMTSDKTSSELIKGKSRYMSPEHVRQVREPCIDIFGVGAIFHEMLDGRTFRWNAEADVDLWSMAFAGDIPPLSIELPAELEGLHRGLLAGDLEQRFDSARAALRELRRWSGYRDASEELGELVRETTVDNAPPTATELLPGMQGDRLESTIPDPGNTAQVDAFETDVSRRHANEGPPPSVAPEQQAMPSDRRVFAAIVALIGLGLGLGGFGITTLINVDRDEPSEVPDAAPAEPAPTQNDPLVADAEPPVVKSPTPVEPTPVLPPPLEPTLVEPTPIEHTKSKSDPKPAPIAKTRVTLTASGYPWVKIRIGSATHVLDRRSSPSKKIALEPGPRAVAFKIDEDEPWQQIGNVSIPAKPTARLELQKPGKVVVK